MVNLTDPLNSLDRCPQCGTARPTLLLRTVMYVPEEDFAGGIPTLGWAIYQCTSCRNPVCCQGYLPFSTDARVVRNLLNRQCPAAVEIIPHKSHSLDDWPERAAAYMRQALESLAAPDGAVMLAGSAVDAMLKHKGLVKGSVYDRITQAVEQNLLTSEMGEWAHSVRLAANSPRHADLDDPHATTVEAQSSLDFVTALGQFLYTLPERVRRGREAANSSDLKESS